MPVTWLKLVCLIEQEVFGMSLDWILIFFALIAIIAGGAIWL
jgi:hypothetical protein